MLDNGKRLEEPESRIEMNTEKLVSVVIPTRNRPEMLMRAVRSALNQTYPNLEVVVVIDGPDEQTVKTLESEADQRVRFIALSSSVGGGEARNTGARASHGQWIALLDDDDEWLPGKISAQMEAAQALNYGNVIISTKYVERSIDETRTFPMRMPDPGESLESYLCCPRGLRSGGEVLQTSTLMVPKDLLMRVPFILGLKRGQDFMWLIQASSLGDASFCVVSETLSIFNSKGFTDEQRVSSKPNWRSFYRCVRDNRLLFTPSAYAYCIAARVLTDAIKCNEPISVKLSLLGECIRNGSGSIKCLFLFLYVWLIPPNTRSRVGESLRTITKRGALRSSEVGTA
jgi:glycosyltransferase involved in cell wall biosynthesis